MPLAALVVVATASEAFASLPGETNTYTVESVGGNPLALRGDFSQARNPAGTLLEVWRGATNNDVWASINNGNPFQLSPVQTNVAPTVIAWGTGGFLVFATGTDGTIWYTGWDDDGTPFGEWFNVPGNFTNMTVSAVQMGTNSDNVYMVYRGLGNDQRVWGTWWGPNGWSTPENIGGGLSITAPSVTYNPSSNRLYVAVQGLDNNAYMTQQTLGTTGWATWASQNINTYDTPHMAVTSNGQMAVSILNANSQPKYAVLDPWGNLVFGWDLDSTGWQSFNSPQLTADGRAINSLFTGFDGAGYWKRTYLGP
jgi:hypothetical protein